MEVEKLDSAMALKREKQDDCAVSLWARLPEELIEAVLALLPVPSLIRAGTVCKRWRSLLNSEPFKLKCNQTPAHRPWLMTVGRLDGYRAYSPADDVWYDLPIKNLVGGGWQVVASASGLLCFKSDYNRHLILMVVDPISKAKSVLPELDWYTIDYSVGLHVLEHSCPVVYSVVLFSCSSDNGDGGMVTNIFHSDVGSWWESSSEIPFPPGMVMDHGVSGSTLYCRVGSWLGGVRIMAYDVCEDSWMEVETKGVPRLQNCILVGCQGEVMLVSCGRDRKLKGLPTGNIKVFLLDNLSREWRELDQLEHMPASKENKDRCFIAGGSKGEFFLLKVRRHRRRTRGVFMMYDHSSRIWKTIVPTGRDSLGETNILSYEPRWGLCLEEQWPGNSAYYA